MKNLKTSKFSNKWREKKNEEKPGGRLLYELSERKPGWRFTARCHTEPESSDPDRGPQTSVTLRGNFSSLIDNLHLSYWFCSIQSLYIILKFDFPWVWALVLEQTLVLNPCVCSRKSWYFGNISKKIRKFSQNAADPWISNLHSSLRRDTMKLDASQSNGLEAWASF